MEITIKSKMDCNLVSTLQVGRKHITQKYEKESAKIASPH